MTSITRIRPAQLDALRMRINRDCSYYTRVGDRLGHICVKDPPTYAMLCCALRVRRALMDLHWYSHPARFHDPALDTAATANDPPIESGWI